MADVVSQTARFRKQYYRSVEGSAVLHSEQVVAGFNITALISIDSNTGRVGGFEKASLTCQYDVAICM
jgi:hypothetical protein